MYASKADVPPELQAWIDEQKRHFTPADMLPAVQLMRAYRRQDRLKAEREAANRGAA